MRGDGLLFQPAADPNRLDNPDGKPVETAPVPPEKRDGVAYFLYCIRNNQPIEGLVLGFHQRGCERDHRCREGVDPHRSGRADAAQVGK